MKEMRLIGNMVEKLAIENKHDDSYMCNYLGCTIKQYQSFLSGRLFLAFEQLEKLAKLFDITIDELMNGDEHHYERSIVHCVGEFQSSDNREMILDIIDDYLTLKI